MKLDRELQYNILKELEDAFPTSISPPEKLNCFSEQQKNNILANILYLKQHQLLDCVVLNLLDEPMPEIVELTITHKGLDFLADDGGISAILNVVTVKLHEDSLKTLLLHQIAHSTQLQDHQKKTLSARIQKLPELMTHKLLEKISERAIDSLFSYGSDTYQTIGNLLDQISA